MNDYTSHFVIESTHRIDVFKRFNRAFFIVGEGQKICWDNDRQNFLAVKQFVPFSFVLGHWWMFPDEYILLMRLFDHFDNIMWIRNKEREKPKANQMSLHVFRTLCLQFISSLLSSIDKPCFFKINIFLLVDCQSTLYESSLVAIYKKISFSLIKHTSAYKNN